MSTNRQVLPLHVHTADYFVKAKALRGHSSHRSLILTVVGVVIAAILALIVIPH